MVPILPKAIPEDQWKLLYGNRVYAFRCGPDDTVTLRLGRGKSIYIQIAPTPTEGRLINLVEYDTGISTILRKISNQGRILIGRGVECEIKILHAYVSRHHLLLLLDGAILIVKDLGSINGTYHLSDNVCFDIDKYLDTHPVDKLAEMTLDSVREAFGPEVDDFLKRYVQGKAQQKENKP